MTRPCPGCLRNTETELVPATTRETIIWRNNTSTKTTIQAYPPYHVCTHCGWSYAPEDELQQHDTNETETA